MKLKQIITLSAIILVVPMLTLASAGVDENTKDNVPDSDKDQGVVDSKYDDKDTKLVDQPDEEGKGTVKVKTKKKGKVLETINVFKDGGVDSRKIAAGTNGAQTAMAAIQESKGKYIKLYNLEGRLLASRKLAKKKAVHEFDTGALKPYAISKGEMYLVTARLTDGDTKAVVQVLQYDEKKHEINRLVQGTVAGLDSELLDEGFSVEIDVRQIRISDENGDRVSTLELTSVNKLVAIL